MRAMDETICSWQQVGGAFVMRRVFRGEMFARLSIAMLMACVAAGFAQAQTSTPTANALPVGTWEVVAVDLAPGRIQALGKDDPAYMGAILDISFEKIAWRPHRDGELSDVCTGPRYDSVRFNCSSGTFGPPGATATLAGSRLRLVWYDNARLVLQKRAED